MASICNRLSQTPKAISHDRNRRCPPTHQTALSYETAAPDGGRLAPKTPHEAMRSQPLSLHRSPRTTERFWRRHPKAHPDCGMTRLMIRDWGDSVRLGGTTLAGFAVCSWTDSENLEKFFPRLSITGVGLAVCDRKVFVGWLPNS